MVGERLESRMLLAADAFVPLSAAPQPAEMNGIIYFSGSDASDGTNRELWRTDGTPEGTWQVAEIREGPLGGDPRGLENVNGTLFFRANDGVHGSELWKSDGTAEGTMLVRDVAPGPAHSNMGYPANVNGTVFFSAEDGVRGRELWTSDGTAAGTVLVKDIRPGPEGGVTGNSTNFLAVGSTLFFVANEGVHGRELWKSDGTASGTVMVKDIRPNSDGSGPEDFIELNGMLLFVANDEVNGTELWKSDGTEAGTVLVKDIRAGIQGAMIFHQFSVNVNGTLFFEANDGTHGMELWKSDGTAAGTVLVKDINTRVIGPYPQSSEPHAMANANGMLLFGAADSDGAALWTSDGTAEGTRVIKRLSGRIGSILPVGETTFFTTSTPETGAELWKTDSTEAGTVMVKDILPGPESSGPVRFVSAGGKLFFIANDGTTQFGFWQSDGTEAGTVRVVRLDNSVPEVVLDPVRSLAEDKPFTITGRFTDPDESDSWSATIDFGDGSGEQPLPLNADKSFQVTHTYSESGAFEITVRVRDAAGAVGSATTTATVAPRPLGTSLRGGVLVLNGTDLGDNIALRLSGSRIIVNATYGGTYSNLSFRRGAIQRIEADLSTGDDSLRIDSRLRQPLFVDAGGGNDRVYAGGGPSLIVGGFGNDLLYGGSGRDILIGGAGRDQLWGYGGSDLLISGRTGYDNDAAALASVMAEWTAPRGYTARVNNLRNGSGPILSGQEVRLVAGETVFQDAEGDTVTGSGELDWFFMELGRDVNRERRKGEAVN